MEFLKNNGSYSNKKKIKIKTFSDLNTLNVDNRKKYPILSLNTQTFRKNSQPKTKLTLNINKKEKIFSERKDYSKEELEKENKELRKRIEILELENSKLKNEIKKYYLNSEEEHNLSDFKQPFHNGNIKNNFKSFQELSLPLNNNFQEKLQINLRKFSGINRNSFGSNNDYFHNVFSRIESSPKKILFETINIRKPNKSNGSLMNNIEFSSFEDNQTKIKMNNLKKRILTLLSKYTEIISLN